MASVLCGHKNRLCKVKPQGIYTIGTGTEPCRNMNRLNTLKLERAVTQVLECTSPEKSAGLAHAGQRKSPGEN